jgi:hypothetical protein
LIRRLPELETLLIIWVSYHYAILESDRVAAFVMKTVEKLR